ncbi:MAG: class III signal peptide-containing protein [Candidatus Diapherotrites archaeon]
MLKEEKAQTSVEYLLILGGAVAAATAIGVYLKSVPKAVGSEIGKEYNR